MPLILVIGGLFVSSLFGAASVLDKWDDITNDDQGRPLINLGTIVLLGVGAAAFYYVTKKR